MTMPRAARERSARADLLLVGLATALGLAAALGAVWLLRPQPQGPAAARAAAKPPPEPILASPLSRADRVQVAPAGLPSAVAAVDAAAVASLRSRRGGDLVRALGEKEHYDAFRALAASDSTALERAAERVLYTPGPDCEKVALLRAIHDAGSPGWPEVFSEAIDALPREARGGTVSVPWFAVRFLAERSAADGRARAVLERVAWDRGPRADPELRRMAAAALAASGSPAELDRLGRQLAVEEDEALRSAALLALPQNPDRSTARWVRERLGLPPAPEIPVQVLED